MPIMDKKQSLFKIKTGTSKVEIKNITIREFITLLVLIVSAIMMVGADLLLPYNHQQKHVCGYQD